MANPKICVVGACNIDLISYVPRLPSVGETLHGSRFHMGFGGKGANQAVMAARLGSDVTMVAKLGRDAFGENTLKNFQAQGISTRHVHFADKAFSGVAPITVDPEGRNSIIIVTGANDLLTTVDIEDARPMIAASKVLICQLEIPMEITLAAMQLARAEGVTTILNPAPAREKLPEAFYQLSDIFCPNESEAALLTGLPVSDLESATKAGRDLLERGPGSVVLTLGERGSLFVTHEAAVHVPVQSVKAVDTTGAGDAFVGSLAHFLAAGKDMGKAIEHANRIAALSVQKAGTQVSFPCLTDLPEDIRQDCARGDEKKDKRVTAGDLAKRIDHTQLKPDADDAAFDRLCSEAIQYGFGAVCVNSSRVTYVVEKLRGTGIAVCCTVGFPLGAMDGQVKAVEAAGAVSDGTAEVDMVMNVGAAKTGDWQTVEKDISAVRAAAAPPVLLKVILETCLLTNDEKVRACQVARKAGADFVKTSTGFSSGGATLEDVSLLRRTVGAQMGVKASGGIRDYPTACAMIDAGADRIGAGSGVAIVQGAG